MINNNNNNNSNYNYKLKVKRIINIKKRKINS